MLATIIKPPGQKVRLLDAPDLDTTFKLRFIGGEEVDIAKPQPPLPPGSTASADDWRFVSISNGAEKLDGWVAKQFLGEAAPPPSVKLIENLFVRSCVRAELEAKASQSAVVTSADYLIAWATLVSGMENSAVDVAHANAGGPFLLDDGDWQDYRDSLADPGSFIAAERLDPTQHVYPAALAAADDLKLLQTLLPPGSDDTGLLEPSFLQVFQARLLGAGAVAELGKRLADGKPDDTLQSVLEAANPSSAAAIAERWQKFTMVDGKGVSAGQFSDRTGNDLKDALDKAFELMRLHYPEYFAQSVTSDEEGLVTGGAEVVIDISDDDVDALSRVSQSEVGHFTKYGKEQFEGGINAVVDTIFNRVAHAKFPNTIQGVVDQSNQFSAINPIKTWKKLPAARADVVGVVEAHINARLAGQASIIKGAVNFLNPFASSTKSLNAWGNYVVKHAVAKFGNEAKKDIHFHGRRLARVNRAAMPWSELGGVAILAPTASRWSCRAASRRRTSARRLPTRRAKNGSFSRRAQRSRATIRSSSGLASTGSC